MREFSWGKNFHEKIYKNHLTIAILTSTATTKMWDNTPTSPNTTNALLGTWAHTQHSALATQRRWGVKKSGQNSSRNNSPSVPTRPPWHRSSPMMNKNEKKIFFSKTSRKSTPDTPSSFLASPTLSSPKNKVKQRTIFLQRNFTHKGSHSTFASKTASSAVS